MTPKEKAQELVGKMCNIEERFGSVGIYEGKECALIAVDEIIKAFYLNIFSDIVGNNVINFSERESNYWEEVKQEIEKL